MINFPKAADIQQSIFIGNWTDSIPIYHIPSMHALNQLVGYIKHINSGQGTVLYRGQCDLYQKVIPSIYHNEQTINKNIQLLQNAIDAILHDEPFLHFLGVRNNQINGWNLYEKLIIEAAFQHYGAKTYCVDFVDNHWTALWFGLNRLNQTNHYTLRNDTENDIGKRFITFSDNYCKKEYPVQPTISNIKISDNKLENLKINASHGTISLEELIEKVSQCKFKSDYKNWQKACAEIQDYNTQFKNREQAAHLYLFLYVAETNASCINGLYLGENTYTIDLRKALPSTFLRPCSQHGWIVRGKKEEFDYNSRIVCVIRVNVNLAKQMLGNGSLLSQANFFPNENIDQGYKILLERQQESRIKSKYNKIIPAGMIQDFNI
ncbi:MAG: FRG domain-containing protein [Clostridia bacterium]|nr:FRG domain-containing protein [Clostridia bacterium]